MGFLLFLSTVEDPWSLVAVIGCKEKFGDHAPCSIFLEHNSSYMARTKVWRCIVGLMEDFPEAFFTMRFHLSILDPYLELWVNGLYFPFVESMMESPIKA